MHLQLKASTARRRTAHACMKPRDRPPHRARRMPVRVEPDCRPSLRTTHRSRLPRVQAAPRNVDRNGINWPSFTLALVRAALLSSGHPLHLPFLLAHLQRRLRQRIRLGLDCGFYLRANSTFLYTISEPRNVHDDIHDLYDAMDDTPLVGSSSLDNARWYRSPAPLCVGDSPTRPNKSDPSISGDVESLADSRTRRSSRAICPRLLAIIRTLGFRCFRTVIHS